MSAKATEAGTRHEARGTRPNRGLIRRAIFGAIAAVVLIAGAWYAYRAATLQPIRVVRFAGEIAPIARADLDRFAEGLRGLPADAASLAAVREAARRIPWVREATVRRHPPDAVEIRLEPYSALARWNDRALVSPKGEVFSAESDEKLPRFSGPEGASAEMAREYPAIRTALLPLGTPLAELKLSARGAWQVVLESGLVLELGRGDTAARIGRFAAAWPRLAREDPPPRYADLRYPNGFAVRRPPVKLPESGPRAKTPPKRA